jgi:hypothetical protein
MLAASVRERSRADAIQWQEVGCFPCTSFDTPPQSTITNLGVTRQVQHGAVPPVARVHIGCVDCPAVGARLVLPRWHHQE